MSKKQFLILLGVWVMIFLFLGFPSAWDKVFALLTGLIIIVMAFKSRSAARTDTSLPRDYVEHKTIPRNPPTSFSTTSSSSSVVTSNPAPAPTSNQMNDFIRTDATIS